MAIDVLMMCLVERWHARRGLNQFIRLRKSSGYGDVDRLYTAADDLSLSTNHGGVVIVAKPGVQLSPLGIAASLTTFEFAAVIVVINRPGTE